MVEADDVFIFFDEAARLVAGACGFSVENAVTFLMGHLRESRPDGRSAVRWRGVLKGQPSDCDPREGSADFWRGGFENSKFQQLLSENTAWRISGIRPDARWTTSDEKRYFSDRMLDNFLHNGTSSSAPSYGFFLIELSRADVIAALPAPARARLVSAFFKEPPDYRITRVTKITPQTIIEVIVDRRLYPEGLPPKITPSALKLQCTPCWDEACKANSVKFTLPDWSTFKAFIRRRQADSD
jgi:hypothetical protein